MQSASSAAPAPAAPSTPLAFWSFNMLTIANAKMSWPGFSYTDEEWTRMRALAAPVTGGAYLKFQFWTAALFIMLAVISITALFTLLSYLYPDPSLTPASVFVVMLAVASLLTIGFGVPLAMSGASRLSSRGVDLASVAPNPMDQALAAKVRWQCWRITAIMCGLFVPGTLLWIAYDIQAGPVATALKYAAIVLMAGSMWFARPR